MSDDQLRSELERRAAPSPTRPGWAKGDLLPAVWHEIDARPHPVITFRWSPALSVVAGAAALLLLLVALPRLIPASTSASPAPAASPTASASSGSAQSFYPSLSAAVAQELDGWHVTCVDVEFVDCHGVAALFVNNLARSTSSVFAESGGQVTVVPRSLCPQVPSYIDPSYCWQATAPTAGGDPTKNDVCMVVGRDLPSVPAESAIFGFAQVGGADMSGRAGTPANWPLCYVRTPPLIEPSSPGSMTRP